MDLDVDVARLKVLKADHQSQQYRLEDKLMKYFPAEIEKTQGFIKGFQSDIRTVAAHPLPEDGFWAGLMEIAKKAGVIDGLVKRMGPVLRFLFPRVPEEHPAMRAAGMNMICNVFGLGAAATPPGLAAMERFEELEEERRKTKNPAAVPEGTANREMCTFLILNISSLQLIPVNIIAYRSQYGSVHPTAIVGPALAATAASTIAAVVFCKVMERMGR